MAVVTTKECRGFTYTIYVDEDGVFRVDPDTSPPFVFTGKMYSLKPLVEEVEAQIHRWMDSTPTDLDGWVDRVDSTISPLGYDGWEIDKEALTYVLEQFYWWRKSIIESNS